MYSEINRVEATPIMKGILKARPMGDAFKLWFIQMSRDCEVKKFAF